MFGTAISLVTRVELHKHGNIKFPIGKSIFAVNLPLKLFRATVANAYIGSLKFLTLFDKYVDHMLVKFELFNRNRELKTIFVKALTPFWKMFL